MVLRRDEKPTVIDNPQTLINLGGMTVEKRKTVIIFLFLVLLATLALLGTTYAKNAELEKTIKNQAAIIDELKNGAERRIAEIRSLFEQKKYQEIYTASAELEKLHPGSKESKEAQKLVKLSKEEETRIAAKKKAEEEAIAAKVRAEEQRRKEIAEQSKQDKARAIIRVSRVSTDDPNSAGGVNFRVRWQNRTNKVVKYADFTVVPYNAVGDIVQCSIRHSSEYTGRVTGPIDAGEWFGGNYYWQAAWYNNTIVKAKLRKIRLEYMDGSVETLTGDEIKYVQY